ncbi:Six-hairpin glycosidase-like protein [Syncephalis pseudoplumigaleata]|uniref:Six-hairpin glycosidase-like protein n=1 Tax=Syncephalis pseudoplumigaleata TaxID=1712513 RepID=A0A4P9Z2P0_9FUNG|nr:Six-hairpin glycosidase-like protein [Syncephalis pseudoplumigaleata]|eukprot:RKP26628.1 Six-hairpin glycosidase-like protein [Syncephalis pseudoplumigaleata]
MDLPARSAPTIADRYATWRQRYMRDEPGLDPHSSLPHRYVFYNGDGDNGDAVTCSEAIGYGMLIAVLKHARDDLDALLRYADYFRNERGLLGWQQRRDPRTHRLVPGHEGGEHSATDGDLDCVAALWMAHKLWDDPAYADRARRWGSALLQHCVHPTTGALLVGDWAHPNFLTASGNGQHRSTRRRASKAKGKIRRLLARLGFKRMAVPDAQWLTRPSDFIMAHLALFARRHTEKSREWTRVLEVTRSIMDAQHRLHPDTGLVADFLVWNGSRAAYLPAKGKVLESSHDGDYNWNSCRVPWRLAHYYLASKDAAVEPHMRALVRFFETKCRDGMVYAGYKLSGQAFVKYTDLAFLAPAAYCLEVMGSAKAGAVRRRVDEAYADASYFGETIAMLTLLQTGANALDLLA